MSLWCFWFQTEFWKSSPPPSPSSSLPSLVPPSPSPPSPPSPPSRTSLASPPVPPGSTPNKKKRLYEYTPMNPSSGGFLDPTSPRFQFEIRCPFCFLNWDWNKKHHCMHWELALSFSARTTILTLKFQPITN